MLFERLAPELLALILQDLDTPLDLYNIISASPSCLQIFSQLRQLILSSVIKNAFFGDNMQHALAVLHTPSTKNEVPSFLEKYFNSDSSFNFPTNKTDLLMLYRLYNHVSYLLDGYFRKTMQELGLLNQLQVLPANQRWPGGDSKQSNSLLGKPVPSPSRVEYIRLQRAFLRFELYCRVFPGHEPDPYRSPEHTPRYLPADQQFSLFLAKLMPWEVEEITCLHEYFYSIIGGFIDELEEEFINAALATPGVIILSPLKEQFAQDEPSQDGLIDFEALDLGDLGLFCRDGRFRSPHYINYMVSLGLDFIYTLTGLDRSQAVKLIQSNHPVKREFLPQALGHASIPTAGYDRELLIDKHDITDDNPSQSNIGYRMFKTSSEGRPYLGISSTGSRYSALRQLGFIFWDADRMRSPEAAEKLTAAAEIQPKEMFQRFNRTTKKSAQDRLKGVKVPIKQMKRLEKDFGSTLFADSDDDDQ